MDKRFYILPFPKKANLGITDHRGITLTDISAKVYNALLLNHIKPETEKILRKKSDQLSLHNIRF